LRETSPAALAEKPNARERRGEDAEMRLGIPKRNVLGRPSALQGKNNLSEKGSEEIHDASLHNNKRGKRGERGETGIEAVVEKA